MVGIVQNQIYYAGANGVLRTTLPSSGIYLKVGIGKDSSTLEMDLLIPVVLA